MQDFFEDIEKRKNSSTNPFVKKTEIESVEVKPQPVLGKRLNLTDTEVLSSSNYDSEIEFIEIKMNNLYHAITQKPQTLDPISVEKMKMEWEDLRDNLYKLKNKKIIQVKAKKIQNIKNYIKTWFKNFGGIVTLIKIYSPKVKQILATFNEINNEVNELVNKATPHGEEEIKYGLLVNKIYQASKLNSKLTNEIK